MKLDREQTTQGDWSVDELDDNDLLRLTRQGNEKAYAALYERYVYAARRLARHLGQREDSDDVVSDAFAQILDLLKRGKGPDRAFRAYLFTTIRHESGRRAKARTRVTPTDDESAIDTAVPFGDGQLDNFEKTAIRAAYESLPERWRTVLWNLDVEGHRASDLADVMGLKPNSVSALVYRARSGLRDAYLQQHVGEVSAQLPRACAEARDKLASVLRGTATNREQTKVHAHLGGCSDCMAVFVSLQDINRDIGTILTPAALVGAIGGGVALTGIGSGSALIAPLVAWLKGTAIIAVPAAAAVTVSTVVAVNVIDHSPSPTTESAPVTRTSAPAAVVQTPAADRRDAASGAAPKAAKASTAPSSVPVVPFGASKPSDVLANPVPEPAAATTAAPKIPVPSKPAPVPTPVVGVNLGGDAPGVTVGPITVSPDVVKDTVDKVLNLPKDLLTGP